MARSKLPSLDGKLLSLGGREKVAALMAAKNVARLDIAEAARKWPMSVTRALRGEPGHPEVRSALADVLEVPVVEIELALDGAA